MKFFKLFFCLFFLLQFYSCIKKTDKKNVVFVKKVPSEFPVNFALYNNQQFAQNYNEKHQMVIAQRKLTDSVCDSEILNSKIGWDSQNYLSLAIDKNIHLSGNTHSSLLVYFRSENSLDIHSMKEINYMTGIEEDITTYLEFIKNGNPKLKHTSQGYTHNLSWARGQTWRLYRFIFMHRFTKDPSYLKPVEDIANFILESLVLPKNEIQFWDFNAPNIPDLYKDVSASAFNCSALIELSGYSVQNKAKYLDVAETQLRPLRFPEYKKSINNNENFIFKHSVVHMPNNTEIDVPLTYADYYLKR